MYDKDLEQQERSNSMAESGGVGKRRTKGRKKLVIPLVLVGMVIIALTVFRVKTLDITGCQLVSEEEVKAMLHVDQSHGNSIMLWLLNRRVDVSSNILLDRVSVKMKNPVVIQVDVEEQPIVGCTRGEDGYYYMNDEGMVLLIRSEKMEEVPVFVGLNIEGAEPGSTLTAENKVTLKDMLNIARQLKNYEIQADDIQMISENSYAIQVGEVRALLGRNIYMEEKVSELNDLMPNLEALSGTLHLEDYDSTKDSIIFTKD